MVKLFSLYKYYALRSLRIFTQIMLPVLKSPTNHGFHELFLKLSNEKKIKRITLIIVTLSSVCVTPAKNKIYDKISATHRLISMITLSRGLLLFPESLDTCLKILN